MKENPFLQSFLEAEMPTEKREFTVEQQRDLIDLIAVYLQKTPYRELEMVQMGIKLCLEFLDTLFR